MDSSPLADEPTAPRRRRTRGADVTADPANRAPRNDDGVPGLDHTQRWVFGTGAISLVVIALAALVIATPLSSAHDELRVVTTQGIPVQEDLTALRTSVVNFQVFIEANLSNLAPGTVPDPALLAKGVQIVQTQAAQATTLATALRGIGLNDDATNIDTGMATFNAATTKLTPIAAGQTVSTAARVEIVTAERSALTNLLTITATLDQYLSKNVTGAAATRASHSLDSGRTLFLLGATFNLLLVLGAGLVFGVRAGRRERARRYEARRRSRELVLQRALDMTVGEEAVYDIVGESLATSVPRLKVEMLIADSNRAHFRRALTNAGGFEGCGVVSPIDCPAATGGQALFFATSSALDACPYLKERDSGPCSAACFPVSIAGRTAGVMHAVGPDESPPLDEEITSLQFTSRRGTDRIAMLRAFAASETQARTDPLTGLLNRGSLESRVHDLDREAVPYTLASGSLDDFRALNDTHGQEAGDQALRLFSRVLRDSVRPNDIAGRRNDDDFLVVLPDCGTEVAVGVLERVRERLALALSAGRVPAFTVTFGVASSASAAEFEDVVAMADRALVEARTAGGNRVAVAAAGDPTRLPVEQL